MSENESIERILKNSKTVAVVGLSASPDRPSYQVASYLKAQGYKIIPVNPNVSEALGEKSYPDLRSIPSQIDVVDIFRRPEHVPAVVGEAISVGAKAIWMQEGIIHGEAAEKAKKAGLDVVMDRCMFKEHRRLVAEGKLKTKK